MTDSIENLINLTPYEIVLECTNEKTNEKTNLQAEVVPLVIESKDIREKVLDIINPSKIVKRITLYPSGTVVKLEVNGENQQEVKDLTKMFGFPVYTQRRVVGFCGLPNNINANIIVTEVIARLMCDSTYNFSGWKGLVFYPDMGAEPATRNSNGVYTTSKRLCVCYPMKKQ